MGAQRHAGKDCSASAVVVCVIESKGGFEATA